MRESAQLATINLDGTPPRSVIADAQSAHEIKRQLIAADIGRSAQRAVLKNNYDGHPPYDPNELKKRGLGDMSNVNMKRATAMTNAQVDSYLDIQFETTDQAQVVTEFGDGVQGHDFSQGITDEFNRTLERWSSFYDVMGKSNFNRVYFASGPCYFEDDQNWQPLAADAGQVLVDRGASTDLKKNDVIMIKRVWRLHELYRMIENPEVATKLGWDVPATRAAIVRAASQNQEQDEYGVGVWEKWEKLIKGNDLYHTYVSPGIVLYDLLAKEYDGTISRRTLTGTDTKDILFTQYKVAKEFEELICPFFLSKQETLWHSVRGLGAALYNVVKMLDKIDNRIFDMTLIGGSLVIQPQTQMAYDKLNSINLGPVTVLPAGVNYVNTTFPNLSQGAIVTHNMLSQTLAQTTGEYQAMSQSTQAGEAPTATQNSNDMQYLSRNSSSQQNQFYNELDNLLTQMFKRLANPNLPDKSTPRGKSNWCKEAREFQKRILARGIPLGALQEPYLQSVRAMRNLGQGSVQARDAKADKVLSLLPLQQNQQARDLMIKDAFTAFFGSTVAKRYFPAIPGKQLRADAKTAQLENGEFQDGHSLDVMDYEDAITHLSIHIPMLIQSAQGLTQSEGAQGQSANIPQLQQVYSLLAVALPHCTAHVQRIASDPTQKEAVQAATNVIRQLTSTATHLQFQLKTAATAAQRAAITQASQQNSENQKMQLEAAKLQLANRKQAHKEQVDSVNLAIKIKTAQQNLHLNDLNASLQVRDAMQPDPSQTALPNQQPATVQ